MREARNRQGSIPPFGRAPIGRTETCAHGAGILENKSLNRLAVGLPPRPVQGGTFAQVNTSVAAYCPCDRRLVLLPELRD